ncbi:unnamed protein product [Lampetra planeri]
MDGRGDEGLFILDRDTLRSSSWKPGNGNSSSDGDGGTEVLSEDDRRRHQQNQTAAADSLRGNTPVFEAARVKFLDD